MLDTIQIINNKPTDYPQFLVEIKKRLPVAYSNNGFVKIKILNL